MTAFDFFAFPPCDLAPPKALGAESTIGGAGSATRGECGGKAVSNVHLATTKQLVCQKRETDAVPPDAFESKPLKNMVNVIPADTSFACFVAGEAE